MAPSTRLHWSPVVPPPASSISPRLARLLPPLARSAISAHAGRMHSQIPCRALARPSIALSALYEHLVTECIGRHAHVLAGRTHPVKGSSQKDSSPGMARLPGHKCIVRRCSAMLAALTFYPCVSVGSLQMLAMRSHHGRHGQPARLM